MTFLMSGRVDGTSNILYLFFINIRSFINLQSLLSLFVRVLPSLYDPPSASPILLPYIHPPLIRVNIIVISNNNYFPTTKKSHHHRQHRHHTTAGWLVQLTRPINRPTERPTNYHRTNRPTNRFWNWNYLTTQF